MSITSVLFIIFLAICLLCYYLIPQGKRWSVLLIASYIFYFFSNAVTLVFLIYSTAVTFITGLQIQKIHESGLEKKKTRAKAKKVVILGMVLDFAMLAFLKYTNDVLGLTNSLFATDFQLKNLILPLGISYYTFQTVGYILDVYWKRIDAETNLFHFALFVSFFPQLIQGPIGRCKTLMPQLMEGHDFAWKNIRFGLMRIVWGLFKSMLLSGWASVYREAICADIDQYSGIAILIVLLYSIELYGSFSGGIDIVLGISELFGIHLDENFRRPYFSVSISDFWRRWHITLGTWMRDYVMYPLTLSHWMGKIGKWARKHFGKRTGLIIPMCISSIIVFFLVGLWHGASLNYIGWGLYNGCIIAISNLLSSSFTSWKKKLHINDQSFGWKIFMILRTFVLVNIGWLFDTVPSLSDARRVIQYSFTRWDFSQLLSIPAGRLGTSYTPIALGILGIGVGILFLVSLLQERGIQVRMALSRYPVVAQMILFVVLLAGTALLSPMAVEKGFIYAQF